MGDKWNLMEHQSYALEIMEDNPSLGIYYSMGTGKTLIALVHAYRRVQRNNFRRILIVCPASLVKSWEKDVGTLTHLSEVTPAGLTRLKEAVVIRSYQKMYRTEKLANGRRKIHLRDDIDHPWDMFVVDESHSIGAHDSIQTKAACKIATMSRERYIMTGTPVHGGGGKADYSKLYGQLKVLNPNIWKTWKEFCNAYVLHYDFFGKPDKYDIPKCNALMVNYAIVCRIEDVIDMPEKTVIDIPCPLAETKVYKDVAKGLVDQYDLHPENAGFENGKLLQVCSGSMKNDSGTMLLRTSKDQALADLLGGTDDKVVIFCEYRASIDRCESICRKAGRKSVIVDGRARDKNAWRSQFMEGDADVCICQYMSGGAGLNLQVSHTMVFFEPTYKLINYDQAISRIYRKGQKNRCLYYRLSTPSTVEEKGWKNLDEGKDITGDLILKWARDQLF